MMPWDALTRAEVDAVLLRALAWAYGAPEAEAVEAMCEWLARGGR